MVDLKSDSLSILETEGGDSGGQEQEVVFPRRESRDSSCAHPLALKLTTYDSILDCILYMTSLLPEVPPRLQHIGHAVDAYNVCLRLEKSLQQAIDRGEVVGKNLIYIRILGYLVQYAPNDQALNTVLTEIISCSKDSDLFDVGRMYFDHYIRACMFPSIPIQCAI